MNGDLELCILLKEKNQLIYIKEQEGKKEEESQRMGRNRRKEYFLVGYGGHKKGTRLWRHSITR